MSKVKAGISFLLLAILTVAVIVVPILLNSMGLEYTYNEKSLWQYDTQADKTLTSKQVIELCSRSLGLEYFNTAEHFDTEAAKIHTESILETVFENSAELCSHFKALADNNAKYDRSYYITSVDNRPVALNIISVYIVVQNESVYFTYEAKTQTLVSFVFAQNTDNNPYYIPELLDSLDGYCKNTLKLSQDEYYLDCSSEYFEYGIKREDDERESFKLARHLNDTFIQI